MALRKEGQPLVVKTVIIEGGVRGHEYRNTTHGSARIPQYRITIYPNTETAGINGKKLTLPILQILLSNRNHTFMSVFQNQGAPMSSV